MQTTAKILTLFIIALLGTSCLSVENNINVEADGSGTISVDVRFSEDLLAGMSSFGSTSEEIQRSIVNNFKVKNLGEGWTSVEFTEPPEGVGFLLKASFSDYSNLEKLLTESQFKLYEKFDIQERDGRWVIDALSASYDHPPIVPGLTSFPNSGASRTTTLKITLPGELQNGNYMEKENNTAIWRVEGETPTNMNASWESEEKVVSTILFATIAFVAAISFILIIKRTRVTALKNKSSKRRSR